MKLFSGAKCMWESHTLLLSPLQALKSIPDPFEFLGITDPREINTGSPFEFSESDLDSDNGEVPPTDWGTTETFEGLADNFLGLDFAPSQRHVGAWVVATPTPQAGSLRAPHYHQDVCSCKRPNPKRLAPRGHATPQSYATANGTLVCGRLQDTHLLGGVDNASSLKTPQKMSFSLSQKVHPYGRTKARRDHGPDDWLSSGHPGEDTNDALSTNVAYAEEYDQLSRAPLMYPVDLPDEKETTNVQSEQLLLSKPDLGEWLAGTLDGVPKMIHLDHLDFALPAPFPARDEGLEGSA